MNSRALLAIIVACRAGTTASHASMAQQRQRVTRRVCGHGATSVVVVRARLFPVKRELDDKDKILLKHMGNNNNGLAPGGGATSGRQAVIKSDRPANLAAEHGRLSRYPPAHGRRAAHSPGWRDGRNSSDLILEGIFRARALLARFLSRSPGSKEFAKPAATARTKPHAGAY